MEWLFGSIKKTAKPEVYVSNVVEGDFNVVSSSQEPARPPYPLYPTINAPQGYSQAPYPTTYGGYAPQQPLYNQQYQRPPYVQQPSQSSSATPLNKPVNPLDSIPFKISALDSNSLPVSEYQLKSIKSKLDSVSDRINSDSYNYSFELERSVLSEVNY